MKKIYFSAGQSLFRVQQKGNAWELVEQIVDHTFISFAVDTLANRMYAGTFNDGVWFSDDAGESWERLLSADLPERIMSLAVSPTEDNGSYKVLWLGSEPSGLYRSEDGGATWTEFPALLELPSEPQWSFPPRPDTHHVRVIQPDLQQVDRIFVGIELGGVMKSEDGGHTWEDRKPNSQYDSHALTMTASAPDRLYEAAGGGFAQTLDGGETWETYNEGLGDYTYLVDIAVNSGDPDVIVASASKRARYAYRPVNSHSVMVRREAKREWEIISSGLPAAEGSTAFHLLADPELADVFYAVNNMGFYVSKDAGVSWEKIELDWPSSLSEHRIYGRYWWENDVERV